MITRTLQATSLVVLAAALPAQLDWRSVPSLHGRVDHSMAYDEDRGRIVMFGGWPIEIQVETDETWEWTGSRWLPRAVDGPSPRYGAGLAWDPHRREILLFGGTDYDSRTGNSVQYGDTWSWNGQRWQKLSPTRSPSPRGMVAMATDPRSGDVVLFGGFTGTGFFGGKSDETWTWNGTTWTLRTPSKRPPASYRSTLLNPPGRQSMLLLGGLDSGQYEIPGDQLWEWDGTDWTQLAKPSAPFPPVIYCAAPDPVQGGVLVLEHSYRRYPPRFWSWDGQAWSEILPTSTAFADWPANFGEGPQLILEPAKQRVLRFGALNSQNLSNGKLLPQRATWAFDLVTRRWSIVHDHPWLPGGQYGVVHDANRGRTLFVGGYPAMQTWSYENGRFHELPVTSPPRFGFGAMIACHYDSGLVVLHGDRNPYTTAWDTRTWLFDGQQWVPRQYPVFPDALAGVLLTTTYDPIQKRILAFDGRAGFDELWSFDPSAGWQKLGPGPTIGGSIAFDAARRRLVYCAYQSGRTWEWDGQIWTEVFPPNPLPYQRCGNLVYVPELGGVVFVARSICGGSSPQAAGTWLFDGRDWRALPVRALPSHGWWPIYYEHEFVSYDPERGRLVAAYPGDFNMPMYELVGATLSADSPYPHPGETMTFQLAEPTQAGRPWLLGLSLSHATGIALIPHPYGMKRRYPLDPDLLLSASLTSLWGRLDSTGNGMLPFTIPNSPALIDLTFHAAALTVDQGWFGTISNILNLEVVR